MAGHRQAGSKPPDLLEMIFRSRVRKSDQRISNRHGRITVLRNWSITTPNGCSLTSPSPLSR